MTYAEIIHLTIDILTWLCVTVLLGMAVGELLHRRDR